MSRSSPSFPALFHGASPESKTPSICMHFDCDGVLFRSPEAHRDAYGEIFKDDKFAKIFFDLYGEEYTDDWHDEHIQGRSKDSALSKLFSHNGRYTSEEVDALVAEAGAIKDETFHKIAEEGRIELIRPIVEIAYRAWQSGIPITVVTSSTSAAFIINSTQYKGYPLKNFFSCFISPDIIKANTFAGKPLRGKPHPDGYLLAQRTLEEMAGHSFETVIVFEDTVKGALAGLEAGATVYALNDRGNFDEPNDELNRRKINDETTGKCINFEKFKTAEVVLAHVQEKHGLEPVSRAVEATAAEESAGAACGFSSEEDSHLIFVRTGV